MAVGGVGGLFGQLFNPGLDDRLAQHITPNPNPLAQQGGPPGPKDVDSLGNPVPAQQPNLAPAAVTQPDPVNSSYAKDLLAASRRDANAQMFNEGMDQMTASFGTAQQQASKQAALRHGGGVGGSLADLASIQGLQDQTIKDNEHARFMSNAAVFAQTLSQSLGRPVSVQEATEIMNNPELMQQFGGAAAGASQSNATQTNDQKNFNAARAALTESIRRANPNMSPEDLQKAVDARMPPDILAMGAGANAEDQAYYAYAAGVRANGGIPDDIITWKAQHATQAKEADATAINIANAKKVLPGVTSSIGNMTRIADSVLSHEDLLKGIMADKNKTRWANDIMKADPKDNTALNAVQSGGLTKEEAAVVGDIAQLHNMNYRGAFSGEGGVKGIRSQVEADRVSRAADQLTNFSVGADAYIKNVGRLKGTYNSALANSSGEAQAMEQIPESARYKLDPSYFSGGVNAPKNLPEWAQVKTVSSKADYDRLSNGQAYKAPNSAHGSRILIKGYEQQSMDEDDGG